MPCPYGINIPQNFTIHNALIDDDMLPNAYGDTASEAFAIKAKNSCAECSRSTTGSRHFSASDAESVSANARKA